MEAFFFLGSKSSFVAMLKELQLVVTSRLKGRKCKEPIQKKRLSNFLFQVTNKLYLLIEFHHHLRELCTWH